jgi:O-antigen/teichoic acid export membrane protein
VAVVPEASVLHARDQFAQLEALHRRAGRFVTAAAAVLTASLVAAAPAVFTAWLGHADDAAALALRGLAVAAYAGVVGGISGAIGRGAGRTNIELEWSALGLVLHTVLAFVLIPRMGLAGALVAIAIANTVAAVWFALRLSHALGWSAGRILWEPFAVPALAMAAGAWAGERTATAISGPWLALVSAGVVAGAVTLAVLFAFRHVRAEELLSLARRGASA